MWWFKICPQILWHHLQKVEPNFPLLEWAEHRDSLLMCRLKLKWWHVVSEMRSEKPPWSPACSILDLWLWQRHCEDIPVALWRGPCSKGNSHVLSHLRGRSSSASQAFGYSKLGWHANCSLERLSQNLPSKPAPDTGLSETVWKNEYKLLSFRSFVKRK